MTHYLATLIVGDDPNPIATTVALDGASLELAAGDHSLGKWPIADLGLERIFGGFRMTVEGEKAILKPAEPEKFAEALEIATGVKAPPKPEGEKKTKKKKGSRRAKIPVEPVSKAATPVDEKKKKARRTERARSATPEPSAAVPQPEEKVGADKTKTDGMSWLDERLEAAHQRFGKYLPDWLFTTGGLVIVLGAFGMLIAKPGWFSTLFLIVAAVGLITSAVALLDQVVAVRIFRGYTPIQGLLASLAIGLVGILLGLIS